MALLIMSTRLPSTAEHTDNLSSYVILDRASSTSFAESESSGSQASPGLRQAQHPKTPLYHRARSWHHCHWLLTRVAHKRITLSGKQKLGLGSCRVDDLSSQTIEIASNRPQSPQLSADPTRRPTDLHQPCPTKSPTRRFSLGLQWRSHPLWTVGRVDEFSPPHPPREIGGRRIFLRQHLHFPSLEKTRGGVTSLQSGCRPHQSRPCHHRMKTNMTEKKRNVKLDTPNH